MFKPTPPGTCIQSQADNLLLLIEQEVAKAVAVAKNHALFEFQNKMKPMLEAAYGAGKADGSLAALPVAGWVPECEGETSMRGSFFPAMDSHNNISTNGPDSKASQQLSRFFNSSAEFGISVSGKNGCLRLEATSGWNTIFKELGITDVHNHHDILDILTKRLRNDHEEISLLRKQAVLREKEIHKFMQKIRMFEQERDTHYNLALTKPHLNLGFDQPSLEFKELATLHLPMNSRNDTSSPARSPAYHQPAVTPAR